MFSDIDGDDDSGRRFTKEYVNAYCTSAAATSFSSLAIVTTISFAIFSTAWYLAN